MKWFLANVYNETQTFVYLHQISILIMFTPTPPAASPEMCPERPERPNIVKRMDPSDPELKLTPINLATSMFAADELDSSSSQNASPSNSPPEWIWRCMSCNIPLGQCNPRQLCRKTWCQNEWTIVDDDGRWISDKPPGQIIDDDGKWFGSVIIVADKNDDLAESIDIGDTDSVRSDDSDDPTSSDMEFVESDDDDVGDNTTQVRKRCKYSK